MLSKKGTCTLKKIVSKKNYVLARCLVKSTVVANTRAWSFIVKKLQKQNRCDIVGRVPKV